MILREFPDLCLEPRAEGGWLVNRASPAGTQALGGVIRSSEGDLPWAAVTVRAERLACRTRAEALQRLIDGVTEIPLSEAARRSGYTVSNIYRSGVRLWLRDHADPHGLPAVWRGGMWWVRLLDLDRWMSMDRTVGRIRDYGARTSGRRPRRHTVAS